MNADMELNHGMRASSDILPGAPTTERERARLVWVWDILLIGVLLIGAYFRYTGVNWDSNTHLHPDERFLTMVVTSIEPVEKLGDYFDTAQSTLNPHNRGYGFYVYGTLPLFIVRYVGEWLGQTGYDEIHLVGRQLSALVDLLTVGLVYLIASRLYHNRRLGLLAAVFSALSVLPIQQSHYFTVDTFTNFFGFLAFYFAVRLLPTQEMRTEAAVAGWNAARDALAEQDTLFETGEALEPAPQTDEGEKFDRVFEGVFGHWETLIPYVLFGAALGMAVASKINAFALAILLPAAVLIRWLSLSETERERWAMVYLRNLVIAAVVSLLFFRIFQPYAFSGPGFFGFQPNQQWVNNIRDQRAQASGDVDFPPALQWARRPQWFAFQNLVVWGLGLPLGILAWAGFAWMGWRILQGEWRRHALIWGWTLIYFVWQGVTFFTWNPTMRYLLLIYPSLAIIAAWAVFALAKRKAPQADENHRRVNGRLILAWGIGASVVLLTFAWAFAFSRIYTRPLTRVEASRWIYQNVPGPMTLHVDTGEGVYNQPLAFRSGYSIQGGGPPMALAFQPRSLGEVIQIDFEHVLSPAFTASTRTLQVALSLSPRIEDALAGTRLEDSFNSDGDPRGKNHRLSLNDSITLNPGQTYYLIVSVVEPGEILQLAGQISIDLFTPDGIIRQHMPEPVQALRPGDSYDISFTPAQAGQLREVTLAHIVDWERWADLKTLRLSISDPNDPQKVVSAELQNEFNVSGDVRGESYVFKFDSPLELRTDQVYILSLAHIRGSGALAVYGSRQVNETSWDDALPVGLDGYSPYDYQLGVYRSDLNFEMYWDDNLEKRERFENNLDQADYIFISSNRQWGTTTRVPERYPLTSEYYRRLIGCPPEREITWCYSVAQVGTFQGALGFELAGVVQSEPNLGEVRFNSQFAEEAYSVYDHPKVLIFKKTAAYDSQRMRDILGAVDLSKVIRFTPRNAPSYPATLMLPTDRLSQQQAGGTWAQLFDTGALINRYPALSAVFWYLTITLLGWLVYPFTRLALRGLPDRGYPLARLVGMLALAYPVWLLGSYRVPFSPLTISLVFLGLVVVNGLLFFNQRQTILRELRERGRYYLAVEALFLAFFVMFLLVRLGNPDLWHPYKGGEKPMDFSYFNAVLKSTSFPPYDPWFAGGYINYYYWGFVLVGVPVKWLGIVPAVAYNLILPTLFAILALAAFSVGWNLVESTRLRRLSPAAEHSRQRGFGPPGLAGWAGLASALSVVVLGNLGTVRMIWHGLQRLAPMNVPFEAANLPTRIGWTVVGLASLLRGGRLPYGWGDWYWIPSRAIPGESITEFPAFTFLYADMHAHMLALPLTVLALSWALSILIGRWGWKGWGHLLASFLLGGLAIGALRTTNTWDWPTYLALGCVAVVYTAMRYGNACCLKLPFAPIFKRIFIAVAAVLALVGLSSLLFMPYGQWYGQGYNAIDPWNGTHTPFWSYITHWGLFLFVIVSWMAWETVDWMANTPASALRRLKPFQVVLYAVLGLLVAAVAYLLLRGVAIAWLVLPLAAWAGILLLRPGMPDARRAVLFMVGTALVLTLFVELAVLRGDLGRMNTVFKFYLQAWTLLALSTGASLLWLLPAVLRRWSLGWQTGWKAALVVLVFSAALFPITASADKIRDRMSSSAPHTLNGMTFMAYSRYTQNEREMDLSKDERAIRWMQENVPGSPVIVEAHTTEYLWGSRFTIHTGLPGVVGWNWHQRQQRAVTPPEWVTDRVQAIQDFYRSNDPARAQDFLTKYNVQYIVVGQLERALYAGLSLEKFELWNGDLWQEVYRDGETVIYQVR